MKNCNDNESGVAEKINAVRRTISAVMYLIHCSYHTNHSWVKGKLGSSTALDKTNQNDF